MNKLINFSYARSLANQGYTCIVPRQPIFNNESAQPVFINGVSLCGMESRYHQKQKPKYFSPCLSCKAVMEGKLARTIANLSKYLVYEGNNLYYLEMDRRYKVNLANVPGSTLIRVRIKNVQSRSDTFATHGQTTIGSAWWEFGRLIDKRRSSAAATLSQGGLFK